MEENEYNKMNYSLDILERFWSKVKIPDDWMNSDHCWEWQAGKYKGYGKFLLYQNKKVSAHRFVYESFKGAIQENFIIRHTCDNPSCVNPNHLILGTQYDNIHDMIERGRDRKAEGSDNGNSILTEENVIKILEDIKNGKYTTQLQISLDYSVSKSIINNILNGSNWTSITNQYNLDKLKTMFIHTNSSLSKKEILEIKDLILEGKNNIEIGKQFYVSRNTISRIRTGKIYKNIK